MLIMLAAASGLRLGELLGLRVEDISDKGSTISVCQQVYRGRIQDRLKTTNAHRIVDIHPDVAVHLARFIEGKDGLVFATTTGRAHNSSNILRRWLHPVLQQLGIPKTGFHAFRRFRATHLRKQRVQESLIKAWLGHSGGTVTDLYDRTATDSSYRKMAVEQAGIGFELPAIVLCVLKSSEREVSVAA